MLTVRNPYDDTIVGELELDQGAALEAKVARAVQAQESWARVPVVRRVAVVQDALAYFEDHADGIARDVTAQMGKPLTQARAEVDALLERAHHMAAIAADSLAAEVLPEKPGFVRRIEHVPLGVVFNIAAWNYPLLIPVNVVVPALLAGNAVLLKHSARTPLCGGHFERAFAGLGEGLVTHLVLDHEVTAQVIGDPRIDHVAFTGSVDGGRAVQRAVGERFIDTGLELGGKDPAYVAADADLGFSAAGVVDGACYNAGQSCCAIERVYVHRDVADPFLRRVRAHLDAYLLGDPMDAATTMGPLASRSALGFLADQIQDALSRGATLVRGGGVHDERFFEPTLLVGCTQGSSVMQEESFGPLVPVQVVANDDEALRLMNDSSFGLTASVWTADRERAERFAAGLDTGTVFQNRCDYLDPALPWVGVGDSGKGATLSRHGFLHLTRLRSVHLRTEVR